MQANHFTAETNSLRPASLPGGRHGRLSDPRAPTAPLPPSPCRRQAQPPGKACMVADGGGNSSLARGGLRPEQRDALDVVQLAAERGRRGGGPGLLRRCRRPWWLHGQHDGRSSGVRRGRRSCGLCWPYLDPSGPEMGLTGPSRRLPAGGY
jgi:hypothetical protein